MGAFIAASACLQILTGVGGVAIGWTLKTRAISREAERRWGQTTRRPAPRTVEDVVRAHKGGE